MKDHARSLGRLMSVLILTLTLICSFVYFTAGEQAVPRWCPEHVAERRFLLPDQFFVRPFVGQPHRIGDPRRDELRRDGERDRTLYLRS